MKYTIVERLNDQLYLLERQGKGSKSQRVTHAAGLVRMDNRIDNNVEESEWVEEIVRIHESHPRIVENEVPVETTFCISARVTAIDIKTVYLYRWLQHVHIVTHLTNLDLQ